MSVEFTSLLTLKALFCHIKELKRQAGQKSIMLSNKRILVDQNVYRPGCVLHTPDCDQFVTIRFARGSTDNAQVDEHTPQVGEIFRITIGEVLNVFVSLLSATDGVLLREFPVSSGETIRVAASESITGKFVVYGWQENNIYR